MNALLLLALLGQDPAAAAPVLEGPEKAELMAEFNVKSSPKGTGLIWDVTPEVPGLKLRPIKTERALIVAGPPGTYNVKLRIVRVDAMGEVDITELRRTLVLSGVGPQPPPNPGPGPGPAPTPSTLGLKEVSALGLSKTQDRTYAATLAKAQRAYASEVAAGAVQLNSAAIMRGWQARNNGVPPLAELGAFQATWKAWGGDVAAKIKELDLGGRLKTTADWAAAFNEIADGLEGK